MSVLAQSRRSLQVPIDIPNTRCRWADGPSGHAWKDSGSLKERTKFVLEWERRWNEARGERVNVAELCRMFDGPPLDQSRPRLVVRLERSRRAKRRALTKARRRRRRAAAGVTAPFADCEAPKAVWCIDFKGWFKTADRVRCYPLTLIDAYSRDLLRWKLCSTLTARRSRPRSRDRSHRDRSCVAERPHPRLRKRSVQARQANTKHGAAFRAAPSSR
jgi:hypothetical protein